MRIITCTTLIVLVFVAGCAGVPAPRATPQTRAAAPEASADESRAAATTTAETAASATPAPIPPQAAAPSPSTAQPKTPGPMKPANPLAPRAKAPPPREKQLGMAAAAKPAAVAEPTATRKPASTPPAPKRAAPVAPAAKTEGVSLRGRLELSAGPRQSVEAGEVTQGLVYFLPDAGASPPKPGRYTIDTHSKGFTPNLLVVPAGSTVSFPNKDTILHNVYSRTPGSGFDLGTYGPGQSRQAVFRKAGLVIVNCNVHHGMRANVVVLATPHYTRPGKDGSFRLDGLPEGPGTLVFWHPRATAGTLPLKAGRNTPVVQRLVATKPRLDAHASGP